jgi:uncharacterized protein YbjT (DUF2867 family)
MISEKNSPILIVGSTGKTGSVLVKKLQKRNVEVRVLVRSAERAKKQFEEEVEIYEGFDYDKPETFTAALSGVEKLYLVSSSDFHWLKQVKSFIDAAKEAKVKHIVRPTGFRCSDLTRGFGASLPGKWHAESEEYIKSHGFIYTFLRPTWFYQNFQWINGEEIRHKGKISMPFGDAHLNLIDIRDIAEVAALALTEPGHENKIYELTGPQTFTMPEIAEIISMHTSRTVRYVDIPYEESRQWVEGWGVPKEYSEGIASVWEQGRLGKTAEITDDLEKVVGHKGITFEQYVKDNLQDFLPQ